jgi:hypothetical protein
MKIGKLRTELESHIDVRGFPAIGNRARRGSREIRVYRTPRRLRSVESTLESVAWAALESGP